MSFEQHDIARDSTGAYHVFALLSTGGSEPSLGTIRYNYEDVDPEAPWRGGRQMVKYVLEPNVDDMTLVGKRLVANIAVAYIEGEALEHLVRNLSGGKLNIIVWCADKPITNIAEQLPFECTVNSGILAMHNPKVFELLKPYLKGSKFVLDDDLFTLLKLSL